MGIWERKWKKKKGERKWESKCKRKMGKRDKV